MSGIEDTISLLAVANGHDAAVHVVLQREGVIPGNQGRCMLGCKRTSLDSPDAPPPAHVGCCRCINGQRSDRVDCEVKNIRVIRAAATSDDTSGTVQAALRRLSYFTSLSDSLMHQVPAAMRIKDL